MTDKELLTTARSWRKGALNGGDPSGWCWMISYPLAGWLAFQGVECMVVKGTVRFGDDEWGHYWIELADGRVLDATCSQFNTKDRKRMPVVYLGKKPDAYTALERRAAYNP